jgi:hypothetical protein
LKKIIIIAISIFVLLSLNSCISDSKDKYEIFLIKGNFPNTPNINELSLEKKPILSCKDIIKYYWNEQTFITKKDLLSKRLTNKISTSGVPFVVVVNGERIYIGKFWTLISSLNGYNPNILVEGIIGEELNKYKLDNNEQLYGLWWNKNDKDVNKDMLKKIFDPRIYNALNSIGILDK